MLIWLELCEQFIFTPEVCSNSSSACVMRWSTLSSNNGLLRDHHNDNGCNLSHLPLKELNEFHKQPLINLFTWLLSY